VSHAKTDKLIKMPFGLFGWDPDLPRGKVSVGGMSHLVIEYIENMVRCSETAELIELPFWTWTRVGCRNHLLSLGEHL